MVRAVGCQIVCVGTAKISRCALCCLRRHTDKCFIVDLLLIALWVSFELKIQTLFLQTTLQALLGDLPLLQYSDPSTGTALGAANIAIDPNTAGVAEVQKVVISSDAAFVREVQSLTLSGATAGTFEVTLSGADTSVEVAYDATDVVLEVSVP